jgi:integrase
MSSGHIRRRAKRSWEIKFDLGRDPATGKRKTQYRSFKGTKREAQAELTRLLNQANEGSYVDPTKTTVAEFLDRWERDWASANVSPKTLERYCGLIHQQIKPHLGQMCIQRLRPVHLNEFYVKLLREGRIKRREAGARPPGLSARSVGHVHRVLHRALGHAVQWQLVQQNVADHVRPPRVEGNEIKILREEEIGDLLARLRGRSLYVIAVLGLATGMRRGEMLALR